MYNIKHMNTIFFQTIRAVAVLCVAMLAFTSEVFAAYSLLPVSTSDIGSTSVVLNGSAESYDEHSFVWFEWSEASSMSAPTVFAMRGFYGNGLFQERLGGLTPGMTYSFRSALRTAGGAVTYSPTVSFKTLGDSVVSGVAASSQSSLGLGTLSGTTNASSGGSVQNTSSNTQTQRVTSVKKNTTVSTGIKNTGTIPVVTGGSMNGGANAAAAIGAGGDILPVTLIGWVALIISVLVIVLIITMIFESIEKRKKKSAPPHLEMAEAKA